MTSLMEYLVFEWFLGVNKADGLYNQYFKCLNDVVQLQVTRDLTTPIKSLGCYDGMTEMGMGMGMHDLKTSIQKENYACQIFNCSTEP